MTHILAIVCLIAAFAAAIYSKSEIAIIILTILVAGLIFTPGLLRALAL